MDLGRSWRMLVDLGGFWVDLAWICGGFGVDLNGSGWIWVDFGSGFRWIWGGFW